MSHARYLLGDVYERLREIPDQSIDFLCTSPPFLALRSYLPPDHPLKHLEIGSEATPAAFLDTLLALTAEWRRVLAPHGSIAVELGDTYANDNGNRTSPEAAAFLASKARPNTLAGVARLGPGWPLAKSLCGIPTLYPWSLAYGRNLLTGAASPAGQWRIRNLLCWARPNPPVGALGDKFRPATSYVTVACVGARRWFDLDAVRTEHVYPDDNRHERRDVSLNAKGPRFRNAPVNPAGAPPLDWHDDRDATWEPLIGLATQPYRGSHYATFPSRLPAVLIDAMCPREVCVECGVARERVVEPTPEYAAALDAMNQSSAAMLHGSNRSNPRKLVKGQTALKDGIANRPAEYTTLGWTDCGHGNYRRGVVLDPFAGSGTTLAAATGLGRDVIGIDLDERNLDLARERIGMFLEVD